MIEIKNVSFTYPDFKGEKTLQNVSLTFPKGEFISLIGKSGSGKSTLFKLLTTQYQVDEELRRFLLDLRDGSGMPLLFSNNFAYSF